MLSSRDLEQMARSESGQVLALAALALALMKYYIRTREQWVSSCKRRGTKCTSCRTNGRLEVILGFVKCLVQVEVAELTDKMKSSKQENTSLKSSNKELTSKVQKMEASFREGERAKEELKKVKDQLVSAVS